MKYSLAHISGLAYRWGDCQAIEYSALREELFPPPYLTTLYNLCRSSGRAKLGILEPLFCGMTDLSHDAITAYLHTRKLVILGEWQLPKYPEDPEYFCPVPPTHLKFFHPLGFCFLSTAIAHGKTTSSAFGAYCFFRESWRTPQQLVLTLLGIAYLIHENSLTALHGIRYADNRLTARWMEKFGFVDVGTLKHYLFRYSTGELEAATISTLSRQKFEELFSAMLEEGEREPEEA